jgi:hypothetical protein
MSDVKSLTVRALRELAKKHLGKGYSKFKTKDELLAALKKIVPDLFKPAAARANVAAKAATKAASVVRFGKKPVRAPSKAAKQARVGEKAKEPAERNQVSDPAQHPAEPLVEGFFVARVAGETEARRHHLVEDHQKAPAEHAGAAGYDEKLGDLPSSYGDDEVLLLPRDPTTVFCLWDFRQETLESAARGLSSPRAVLRVFEGGALVRQVDFAFESKSFYVHGLPPGRTYRVEAYFVGDDGRAHLVGRPSNSVALPPVGPSSDLTLRFLRIPWGLPLSQLKVLLKEGRAEIRQQPSARGYVEVGRTAHADSASLPWAHAAPPPHMAVGGRSTASSFTGRR